MYYPPYYHWFQGGRKPKVPPNVDRSNQSTGCSCSVIRGVQENKVPADYRGLSGVEARPSGMLFPRKSLRAIALRDLTIRLTLCMISILTQAASQSLEVQQPDPQLSLSAPNPDRHLLRQADWIVPGLFIPSFPSFNSLRLDEQLRQYGVYLAVMGPPDILIVGSSRSLHSSRHWQTRAILTFASTTSV
jgi:hypothetical protein